MKPIHNIKFMTPTTGHFVIFYDFSLRKMLLIFNDLEVIMLWSNYVVSCIWINNTCYCGHRYLLLKHITKHGVNLRNSKLFNCVFESFLQL